MSDAQFTSAVPKHPFIAPTKPELDESLWRAWTEKNRAKDRVRSARRKRVLAVLVAAALATLILARVYGQY